MLGGWRKEMRRGRRQRARAGQGIGQLLAGLEILGGVARDLDLETLELEHIRRVLESVGGNKSEAARILGINRRTLYRKHVPN